MACRIKSTPDTVHSRQSINVETVTRCGMWTQIADACGYCVQRLPTPGHPGLCFCPKGGQRVHPGIPSRSCPASMLATAPDLPLRGGLTHAACPPACLSVCLPTYHLSNSSSLRHRRHVDHAVVDFASAHLHSRLFSQALPEGRVRAPCSVPSLFTFSRGRRLPGLRAASLYRVCNVSFSLLARLSL